MRNLYFSVIILTCVLITPVLAQPMQGPEFYNYFEEYIKVQSGNDGNSIKAGMFLGYIRGILDALDGTALCLPNNTPIESLIQQVMKYLHNRGQSQQVAARTLILDALRGQFSCRR